MLQRVIEHLLELRGACYNAGAKLSLPSAQATHYRGPALAWHVHVLD